MPIVLRYVYSKKEINDRFIKFVECDSVIGEASADNIECTLVVRLFLENCPGQSYEGASAMSGQCKGVSGRILTKNLSEGRVKELRWTVDDNHNKYFDEALELANSVNVKTSSSFYFINRCVCNIIKWK